MVNDHGIIPAILVALLVGALVGLINGVGIAYGKLQPFIMTLGTMYMASGAASIYTNGTPISIKGNFSKIGNSMLFNTIPLPEQALGSTKIRQLDVTPLFAEAIRRTFDEVSISSLF